MNDRPASIDRAITQYRQVLAAKKLAAALRQLAPHLCGEDEHYLDRVADELDTGLTPAELNPEILAEGEEVS